MRVIAIWAAIASLSGVASPHPKVARVKPLTQGGKIVHLLDRATFGPRPGDFERVQSMGIDKFIDEQLHPDRIDDSAADAMVAGLKTLDMPSAELTYEYRTGTAPPSGEADLGMESRAAPAVPRDPETRRAIQRFAAGVDSELRFAKTARAVESKRQLQEVMVDFWTNHFNIDTRKNADRVLKTVDDREVIRKYALGRFRDLLGASAHSPAMLVYLDNAQSSAAIPGRRTGLNENYAREIMELHTLGVEGGYTQKDVQEVARCLTGWSIDPRTGQFRFYPRRHDNGEKTVLGHVIPAGGGVEDGETVLDILARQPATAHFISWKLCRRFVADNPPKSVVDRAARVFRRTDGDIAEVVKTILLSPEFNSAESFRSKTKSPFEFVVSAVRALDAHLVAPDSPPGGIPGPAPLVNQTALLGEPLFQCQPPTGYSENSAVWVSAGGSIARMNLAVALARRGMRGVTVPDLSNESVSALQTMVLRGHGSKSTVAALTAVPGDAANATTRTALLLGSPEFQRR